MKIVFVHLGTRIPKYLESNLRRHIDLFGSRGVVLIHDQHNEEIEIERLETYRTEIESSWKTLDRYSHHPKDFRNNFWLHVSTRFFALEQYMRNTNEPILHVESDVILSRDFPFDRFAEIQHELAFPVMSELRGVGSTVFVKNHKSAKLLTSNLLEEVRRNPHTTEMLTMKRLFEENKSRILRLPIGPPTVSVYRNANRVEKEELLRSSILFGGVMDGVEIGQYFFGTDPRNKRGIKLVRHDLANGFLDVTKTSLKYDDSREFPNLVSIDDLGVRTYTKIFSLHLPSKEIKLFRTNRQKVELRRYSEQSSQLPESNLVLTTLVKAILRSARHRMSRNLGLLKGKIK